MRALPHVPLGKLLVPIARPEIVHRSRNYRILGAHWYAGGLYIKAIKLGSEIQADRLYRVQRGDFVYNRLFAWKGSFAIATEEDDGCYVSNEFPCFRIDESSLDGAYLRWYFSQSAAWTEALGLSTGGTPTSRNRLKEDKLLAIQLPLPPLSEQRRIVARIEHLAAKIEQTDTLRVSSQEQLSKLYNSTLNSLIEAHAPHWRRTTVGDVIVSMDAGWSPKCHDRPAKGDEWGVLKTTSVQWNAFYPHENKALPLGLLPRPELSVESGDVLVTRAGPRKRVAVVAAVRQAHPKLTISDKLIRLRVDPKLIEPRFLEMTLASPYSQEYMVRRKTGLADAQVNISQAILRATPIAFPSLPEQRRIVAYLDNLQTKVDALKALQAQSSAELDALLPSILDRAFKGEL